jgi:ATP-dependent DNA helicase RecQ
MFGALVLAQKILSSVVRQGERFGAEYTAGVLTGSQEDRIVGNHHDRLSTYGILSEHSRSEIRDWIEQLVEQECLERVGEYGVLQVTQRGRQVLKGQEEPLLTETKKKKAVARPRVVESWESVDSGLFEALREVRRQLARQRRLPAYIVFGDAALWDMARKKPSTPGELLRVSGVGEKKLELYGEVMLKEIRDYLLIHSRESEAGRTPGRH